MTIRPVHQQRNAYKLTAEEAGALLWYRNLPFLARRCLCSLVLRLMAGMSAEDAGKLYHYEAAVGPEGALRAAPDGTVYRR